MDRLWFETCWSTFKYFIIIILIISSWYIIVHKLDNKIFICRDMFENVFKHSINHTINKQQPSTQHSRSLVNCTGSPHPPSGSSAVVGTTEWTDTNCSWKRYCTFPGIRKTGRVSQFKIVYIYSQSPHIYRRTKYFCAGGPEISSTGPGY